MTVLPHQINILDMKCLLSTDCACMCPECDLELGKGLALTLSVNIYIVSERTSVYLHTRSIWNSLEVTRKILERLDAPTHNLVSIHKLGKLTGTSSSDCSDQA